MDVCILCVGKLKEAYWRDACAEYSKRLTPFCRFSIVELAEEKLSKNPSDSEINNCIEKEGQRILEKIPSVAKAIAMCIEGKTISSEQLAETLESSALNGYNSFYFIIGGSFGLSESVKKRADLKISMGRMTFPHQLARVMLCEQIYRGFSIINNSKYHK